MFDTDPDDDANVCLWQSRFVEGLEAPRETCWDVIVVITCMGSSPSRCSDFALSLRTDVLAR